MKFSKSLFIGNENKSVIYIYVYSRKVTVCTEYFLF